MSRVSADELTTAALKHSVRVDVLSIDDDGAPRHNVEDEGRVTDDAVILVVEIAAPNYGGERLRGGVPHRDHERYRAIALVRPTLELKLQLRAGGGRQRRAD